MSKSLKLSLEWVRITDPTLLATAQDAIISNIDLYLDLYDKTKKENLSKASLSFGYNIDSLYSFPIGKINTAIYQQVEVLIGELLQVELPDYNYRDMLSDSILEGLINRFSELSCAQILEGDESEHFLVSTYEALKNANFSFNQDKTIACPPKLNKI